MISAFQKDDVLLADVSRARAVADELFIWWLGQSGFLILWNDFFLLVDPYLSDSLTKKYSSTDKPHERMTERVIDPARLDFVDVVTSSHNHTDHLDAETLVPLIGSNPKLVLLAPEANREFVANRIGADLNFPVGLDAGQTIALGPLSITAVPAAHESIERDSAGRCVYLGYVFRLGGHAIYHSGDTIHYEGMEDWLRPHCVTVALLPINGADPARRVAGNLDGPEAARLAHDIGARIVVPCHYDMFEFNTASPERFESTCRELGQPYRTLRAGECLRVPAS